MYPGRGYTWDPEPATELWIPSVPGTHMYTGHQPSLGDVGRGGAPHNKGGGLGGGSLPTGVLRGLGPPDKARVSRRKPPRTAAMFEHGCEITTGPSVCLDHRYTLAVGRLTAANHRHRRPPAPLRLFHWSPRSRPSRCARRSRFVVVITEVVVASWSWSWSRSSSSAPRRRQAVVIVEVVVASSLTSWWSSSSIASSLSSHRRCCHRGPRGHLHRSR